MFFENRALRTLIEAVHKMVNNGLALIWLVCLVLSVFHWIMLAMPLIGGVLLWFFPPISFWGIVGATLVVLGFLYGALWLRYELKTAR